jgi:hypothetical protein
MDWFIKRLNFSQKYNLKKTLESCVNSLISVLDDVDARLVIFVEHWVFLAPLVVLNNRLWEPIEFVLIDLEEQTRSSSQ